MEQAAHLYFHSPCFDGIVSCVLAWDFLETSQGWSVEETHPVNYDARSTWLSMSLNAPAAIVDFLYHPEARFWADHHVTTFLTEDVKKDFERRRGPWLAYDESSGSCAMLLWKHFASQFRYRNTHYETMVEWADRIDSARYASVDEAIFGTQPALRINLSFVVDDGKEYGNHLVRLLRSKPLDQVAGLSEIRERADHAESMIRAGLDHFAKESKLEPDGIVVFDIDASDVTISRYAPYYRFPEARYSVGILRHPKGASITAMRNPWQESPSVPLGEILKKFGGGGHQRVGALLLPSQRSSEAILIRDQILCQIRWEERGGASDTEF